MKDFESPIEKAFAKALYAELAANPVPIGIYPQSPVGQYAVDFALVGPAGNRVIVECDGHDFHERTPEQAEHDKKRDRFLVSRNLRVLRFTGREIRRDAAKCAEEALAVVFGAWPPADEDAPFERRIVEPESLRETDAPPPSSFLGAVQSAGCLEAAESLGFIANGVETVTAGFRRQLPAGDKATKEEKGDAIVRIMAGFGSKLPQGLVRSFFMQCMAQHFGVPEFIVVAEAMRIAAEESRASLRAGRH